MAAEADARLREDLERARATLLDSDLRVKTLETEAVAAGRVAAERDRLLQEVCFRQCCVTGQDDGHHKEEPHGSKRVP